jgi:hypothetical protein
MCLMPQSFGPPLLVCTFTNMAWLTASPGTLFGYQKMTNDLPPGSAADGARPEFVLPHGSVLHPWNEQFRAASTAQIMQTLALHLEAIAHGQNLKWTVRSIEEFFWKELGLPPAPDGYEDVPRFLLADSHQLQPHLDAPTLANTVAQFMLPQPPELSVVATNLRMLGEYWNLTNVESKILLWSWCHARSVNTPMVALGHIKLTFGHKYAVLSLLFDEPVAAVQSCFEPYRLLALGLIDPEAAYRAGPHGQTSILSQVFRCTDRLINLLETPSLNDDALLNL